jgi:DNA-binding NarL/FixJ family response regulator
VSGDSNAAELTVVVADDDRLTALTLGDSLSRYGLSLLAVLHTPGEALATTLELKPDVLVVDLDFGPGPNGIDVALKARARLPLVGVVIITAYEDPRLLAPGLPGAPPGAVYLVKQQIENPEQVAVAARLSVDLAMNPPRELAPRKRIDLTDPQVELLRLVALGLSNHAIAQQIFQSPDSVKKSISRLAKKLGVDHSSEKNVRVGLTHRYLQHSGHSRA